MSYHYIPTTIANIKKTGHKKKIKRLAIRSAGGDVKQLELSQTAGKNI